jgi:hypothetical protein
MVQQVRTAVHTLPEHAGPFLILLAAALTVLDASATIVWLEHGHLEANPWLNHLVHTLGAYEAMAVRVTAGLGLLAALGALLRHAVAARVGLVLVTGVLMGVGFWHAYGAYLMFLA